MPRGIALGLPSISLTSINGRRWPEEAAHERLDRRQVIAYAYGGGFVSVSVESSPAIATLEILWRPDGTACALARDETGRLPAPELTRGHAWIADLGRLGRSVACRRLELADLAAIADTDDPDGIELGGSARAVLAIVRLAARSVTEGLAHPSLEFHDGSWHAMWGPTLDETVLETLDAIAAALPPILVESFDGDSDAAVHDLYAFSVDQLARRRLRDAGVQLEAALWTRGTGPLDLFLRGLTSEESALPRNAGYAALERRISAWVDDGLAHRSSAPWEISLRLDEKPAADGNGTRTDLALWLHAADDPTLTLPAALLWQGRTDVFAFVRASDPGHALIRKLEEIDPLLAEGGIRFGLEEPSVVALSPDDVRFLLRDAMPKLEEVGVPVLLPAAWVGAGSRLRVQLTANRATSPGGFRSSGLLTTGALATFDWKIALGDTTLSEEELRELAAAK